ncbi:DUF4469 domain-containing protein [Parabacteroides gordonii]|uniref:DUF4469 domain-containing protein n=1 Tax=Parabacteroides gordonii TaxID=574930 RepID=UPI0026EC01EE|nr:DUF4469 domain-containing protein [Parabacteroides gordonii]
MANTLKAWMAPNSVTSDPKDKIFVLETTGKADIHKIYEEMRAEDTGLRPETIVHVVTLFERVCARMLMNGWQLNTGLFYAVPRLLGLVDGGKWNPESNSIYVAFSQDKVIREEIAKTTISILGSKADVMYITETEDRKTGLKDGRMTPGRNFFVRGANLKVLGEDESVGVTLTNTTTKAVVKLDEDMITKNNPSELTLLMPADLADGDYLLTVRTQFGTSNHLLKEPREVSVDVHVGDGGGGSSEDDRPVIE